MNESRRDQQRQQDQAIPPVEAAENESYGEEEDAPEPRKPEPRRPFPPSKYYQLNIVIEPSIITIGPKQERTSNPPLLQIEQRTALYFVLGLVFLGLCYYYLWLQYASIKATALDYVKKVLSWLREHKILSSDLRRRLGVNATDHADAANQLWDQVLSVLAELYSFTEGLNTNPA